MLTLLGFIAFSIIPFGLGVLVGMFVGLPSELEEREEKPHKLTVYMGKDGKAVKLGEYELQGRREDETDDGLLFC